MVKCSDMLFSTLDLVSALLSGKRQGVCVTWKASRPLVKHMIPPSPVVWSAMTAHGLAGLRRYKNLLLDAGGTGTSTHG